MFFRHGIVAAEGGSKSKTLVLCVSLLFVLVNAYCISIDFSYLNYLPIILLGAFAFIVYPQKLYFVLLFFAPLSVPLSEYISGLDIDLWLPTEPLIFAFLVLIILKSFHERYFDKNVVNHPVFWAILFYWGWLVVASFASDMPIVSIKYTLVRLWFIAVFFYIAYLIFLNSGKGFEKYFGAFLLGLLIVVLISLHKQLGRGLFDKFSAHGSCNPYFTDHTSYGAALAFVIPVIIGFVFFAKRLKIKFALLLLGLFFTLALVLSYSRAAWLSLIFGVGIWAVWLLKVRIKVIVLSAAFGFLLIFSFQGEIVRWMDGNQVASSGNLQEHLRSITNIKTDDSNVERLNRWTSAISMFDERPFFGWGPGTYMFLYAPYQLSSLKTAESSNLGVKGNAHSEYLGLMAESGWPGALGYILIIASVFYRGFVLVKRNPDIKEKPLILGVLVGLATYVFHGVLNNFLDMDKIAALFWGYIAFVVAMDVKYRSYRNSNPKIEISSNI